MTRHAAAIPSTRQVRVLGILDGVCAGSASFRLRLESGEEVCGVANSPELLQRMSESLGKLVLVHGKAIYSPTGRLLRLDAAALEDGAGQPSVWSTIPAPLNRKPKLIRENSADVGKRGVAAFFGSWPGDETAQELEDMIRELRGQ